jgi:hypothetical protein
MGKVKQGVLEGHRFETWSSEDQEQCEDRREASSLLAFVVLSMFLAVACALAGILSGRV